MGFRTFKMGSRLDRVKKTDHSRVLGSLSGFSDVLIVFLAGSDQENESQSGSRIIMRVLGSVKRVLGLVLG